MEPPTKQSSWRVRLAAFAQRRYLSRRRQRWNLIMRLAQQSIQPQPSSERQATPRPSDASQ